MLVVGAGAAAVVATQTAWFRDWLRGYIVKQANQNLNGRLSIGRLGGNLFYGVEMENVALAIDGREAVRIRNIGVKYNALQMITKGISIAQLRVDQPVVHLWRSGDSWAIARVVKKEQQEADRSGPEAPDRLGANRRQRWNDRDRRSRRGGADARAVAVRAPGRQRRVSLRAGSLLGGHQPRVVPRIEPRSRAELAVGRRRGA